jgi:GH24 family phage-related lysozyme (muramidase)
MNKKSQLDSVIGELRGGSKDLEAQRAAVDKQIVDLIMKQTSMNPEDIVKGLTNRKKTAKQETATKNTSKKVGNVNTNFYADAVSASKPKLRTGDSAANVGAKIYAVIKQDIEERKLRSELSKNFEDENFEEEKRRHDELIAAINKSKQPPPKEVVKKATQPRDEQGRFIKKEPPKAPEATKAPEAPKKEVAPEPTAPAKAPPTAKPAPEAPKAPAPTVAKPPAAEVAPKIPTAVKAGAAAAVGAVAGYEFAKSMIMKHEGFKTRPYKDSKGLWTVGVGHLIGDGKTLPKEWDREFSKEEIQTLYEEDFREHKKAAEKIPGFNKLNEKGQTALIDLTFNMGPSWYKKWPMLMKQLEAGDIEGAAKNLEGSDWYKQVKTRGPEVVALLRQGKKETATDAELPRTTGSKMNDSSIENKELKAPSNNGAVVVNNTKTTIVSGSTPQQQVIRTETPSEKPALLGG